MVRLSDEHMDAPEYDAIMKDYQQRVDKILEKIQEIILMSSDKELSDNNSTQIKEIRKLAQKIQSVRKLVREIDEIFKSEKV